MKLAWAAMFLVVAAAGCGGGGEKAPVYTPVSATSNGNVFTLQLGDMKVVIDGDHGGRVTELSLFGDNVLVTQDQSHSNYGVTYWPSPQSSWCAAGGACWPPSAAVDEQVYGGAIDATNTVAVASNTASVGAIPGSTFVVSKWFTPLPDIGAVDVKYGITNTSPDVSLTLAPWQVARVATGGLTFFGQGSGDVTYAPNSDPSFAVTEEAGNRWYQSAPVNHDSKLLADGTGWLAHVTPDRLLFLSSAPDIQPAEAAPGEAEVELFTNRDFIYVEAEQQGALVTIAPDELVTWTVRWKLRRVPGGTPVAAGSAALADFAASVLAE